MRNARFRFHASAKGDSRGAFTLVETLVVAAIIAIIAALVHPAYQRVVESSRATACVSNLRQLGAALNLYLGDNGMLMPELKTGRTSRADEAPTIDNTLDKYVQDNRIFTCPADRKYAASSGTSYFWNSALNGQSLSNLNFLNLAREHSRIPVLYDKEGFHPFLKDKLNILYADGHATNEVKFWSERL